MRTHTHHKIARSRGGTDDEWNLVDWDPYTHAYEHALDFVLFERAPKFDYRHEAWPLLPKSLQEAVKKRHAEWNSNFFTGKEANENQIAASKKNILIAVSSRTREQNVEQGRKNGRKCAELGLGVCAPGHGEQVSKNMRNLVSSGDHWFQTEEHSKRVSERNQIPHTCPVCGEVVKGDGPMSLHVSSHEKDHLRQQIREEYTPRGKTTGYGNLSELSEKYGLDKSTILRIVKNA